MKSENHRIERKEGRKERLTENDHDLDKRNHSSNLKRNSLPGGDPVKSIISTRHGATTGRHHQKKILFTYFMNDKILCKIYIVQVHLTLKYLFSLSQFLLQQVF